MVQRVTLLIRTLVLCTALSCTFAAEWRPLGPFGGTASFVVAVPHAPRTFLAATRNALLFRTADGGDSWTSLPFPPQLRATLNVLSADPHTPGVYLAGLTSDLPQFSGMLRSMDSGITWQQVPDLKSRQVRAIAFKRG